MNRRDFFRKGALWTMGGLVAGPEALEALERLTWRKSVWQGATFGWSIGTSPTYRVAAGGVWCLNGSGRVMALDGTWETFTFVNGILGGTTPSAAPA